MHRSLLGRGQAGCYPPYVSVGLPQGHAAVVRDSAGKHALLGQLLSLRVPAQHRGNDLIFVVSASGNEELVVTG